MKRMSFSLTKRALLDGTKTVTRRLGWLGLRAGDKVLAVSKCMGLKHGESAEVYGVVTVKRVDRVPLDSITSEDCAREGFPQYEPAEFVAMFCKAMRCLPSDDVARIEFDFEPMQRTLFESRAAKEVGRG